MLADIDSLSANSAGNLRELIAERYFARNGFESLDGKCLPNCLDGVYMRGGKVIINEVKPLNADGSIRLSSGNSATGLDTQITENWILGRAKILIDSRDPAKVRTGRLIEEAMRSGNLTTVISGVSSNGMVIVKVKP